MRCRWVLLLSSLLLLVGCASTSSPSNPTKVAYNPQAAEYNVQLGLGYLKQNNYDRAKQKLLVALSQDPKSSTANSAMAYFLEKTGDYSSAENYYKNAITLAAEPGAAQNNYGTFLCRRGQYTEAEQQFLKAATAPNYLKPANAYENAGLCALLIPDAQQATKYFELALQKNPNMNTSILQLGEIYYNQGDYNKSYNYLGRYLKNNAPNAEALWLGIRLAKQRGDQNSVASYAALLKSQFSTSTQYQEYLKLTPTAGN